MRQAAEELAAYIGLVPRKPREAPAASPEPKESDPAPAQGFKALDYLDHDHEACKVFADAKGHGLGFAAKGVLRGKLAIPLYRDGTLAGYVGIPTDTELTLPKNLKPPV